jgi:hypothetical protein
MRSDVVSVMVSQLSHPSTPNPIITEAAAALFSIACVCVCVLVFLRVFDAMNLIVVLCISRFAIFIETILFFLSFVLFSLSLSLSTFCFPLSASFFVILSTHAAQSEHRSALLSCDLIGHMEDLSSRHGMRFVALASTSSL